MASLLRKAMKIPVRNTTFSMGLLLCLAAQHVPSVACLAVDGKRVTQPSCKPALAGTPLLGADLPSAVYAVLGSVALVAGLLIVYLFWLRGRFTAEEDSPAGGVTLDMSLFDHPDEVQQQFHQTIRQLQLTRPQ